MREIQESGMRFVVDENRTFFMEESAFVGQLAGMSKCEFVTMYANGELSSVEAKTSFSNPDNASGFEQNISDIVRKFMDSLQIVNAVALRHEDILPKPMRAEKLDAVNYKFYLVIKNHQSDWLQPVSDILKSRLKTFFRLWNIPDTSIKVLNEPLARRKGLIS